MENEKLTAAKKWFREAQFGGMAHFGLYTLLAGEWKGRRPWHPYSEWIQNSMCIPNAEYSELTKAFDPMLFNADEWIMRVRDAGMKYFVFTSKHHDGFAMYHSKVSKFNVVDATPFRRDIVGELAEACRKHGVKFGLYYSQDFDWHEPDGGGFTHIAEDNVPEGYYVRDGSNYWDFKDRSKKEFDRYFYGKSKPQVEEILTQYGDLCLIWFDMPETLSLAQSTELRDLVRQRQPGCLVSGRIGNGLGDYETPNDNALPESGGDRLFETVGTMNDSWGFYPGDRNYKSLERILEIKAECRAKNANYLLNFGPDPLGRIPANAIDILEGLKKRL